MAQCCLLMAWLAGRSWHWGSRPMRNCGPGIGIIFPWWTPDATTRLTFMVEPALDQKPGDRPRGGREGPGTRTAIGRDRLPRNRTDLGRRACLRRPARLTLLTC